MTVPVAQVSCDSRGASKLRVTEGKAARWNTTSQSRTARATAATSVTLPWTTSTRSRTAVRLASWPVLRLSKTRTCQPCSSRASTRWEPMKPAPPVTKHFRTVGLRFGRTVGAVLYSYVSLQERRLPRHGAGPGAPPEGAFIWVAPSPMKSTAKVALCGIYKFSGAMHAQEALARPFRRPFMAVLLFHRVTDVIPEDGLTVSPRHFEKICQMLRRSFHVVPLETVFRILRQQLPV